MTSNTPFLTIEEAMEVTGLSRGALAQLRFEGKRGPVFYSPTPRAIRYKYDELISWVEASARTGTAQVAA